MDFKKFYEEQGDYAAFRGDPERQAEYRLKAGWKVTNLCSLVPDGHSFANILEIGCAMGILLNELASKLGIRDLTGIDISEKNTQMARSLFPEAVFLTGTIEELSEGNAIALTHSKYDLVVLSDIIEHIPDDLGFLMKVRRISDYVLVNLPLEKSFSTRNRNYGESDPSGHLRAYDEAMATDLFRSAGFEIVKSFTLNPAFDRECFDLYRSQRSKRIRNKPLLRRIFWMTFYKAEDLLRFNRKLYVKIKGANYFAILRSLKEDQPR